MGKKRRNENSEERIHRKIRKLERRLSRRRSGIIYSSDEEFNHLNEPLEHSPVDAEAGPSTEVCYVQPLSPTPPPEEPVLRSTPPPPTPPPAPTSPSATDPTVPSGDVNLDDEILQLLGDAPDPETTFGATVHKDIAARWHNVLKKGLTKECKEIIFKEYLIPSNCELLVPPILNPEAKAALTDTLIKRDASMISRQRHLSVAVAALTHTLEKIIANKDSQKSEIVKPISDACRILCDMHHYETETRKKFVISSTNTGMRDALLNSTTDKFLFGENMSEKLKTAKTVQKSGEELKNMNRPQNPKNFPYKSRGNYKTLHQKRPEAGRSAVGPRQQWTYPRSRTAGRMAPPQAPAQLQPPPPPPPHSQPPHSSRRTGRR